MGFGEGSGISWTNANNLHLDPARLQPEHRITRFFTGRMFFLTASQQCQSTEGMWEVSTCEYFERQENDDGEPVEHVVDGGGGERSLELVAISRLRHRHDRVGQRRADVHSHDDRDRRTHWQD